ncbi:phosphoribosylamine--glycine ligase [Fusobacterium necrophorum subsp. necrophorum]|nr:phosphoribosylamine--glycine ligase [Fusobacterium necrophorum subsp. necrophorum]
MPVIIKATDLQGSRGIYIAQTKEEVLIGYREAMKLTRKDYCIIEEFIEGEEFGAQSFVFNNEILFVATWR